MTSSSIPCEVIDIDVNADEQNQWLSSLSGSNTIQYLMHHDTKMYYYTQKSLDQIKIT